MADPWADFIPAAPAPTAPAAAANADPWADFVQKPSMPKDIGKSLGIGLAKGAIATGTAPRDVPDTLSNWSTHGLAWLAEKAGLLPEGKTAADFMTAAQKLDLPADNWAGPTAAGVEKKVEGYTGEFYKPQTTQGKYAEKVGEFLPGAAIGPGRMIPKLLGYGVAPAVTSEAAGQALEGTAYEAPARVVTAIGTGGAAAFALRPNQAGAAVSRATEGMTPAHLDAMEALMRDAQAMGLPLTRAEAAQAVTNGATRLADLQRVTEGQGQLRPFMAQRPQQVENVGRQAMDTIAPAPQAPSTIGPQASAAAREGMAATPEGQALANAEWQVGPRVSPEQAGSVIQPELRAAYDRREGMRAALADQDYAAARNSPATVPLDGDFGFREVSKHSAPQDVYPVTRGPDGRMRRMSQAEQDAANLIRPVPQPILTRESNGQMRRWADGEKEALESQSWGDIIQKRDARMADLNTTEMMPVIGLKPTRFGQADASSVLSYLDKELETAKGAVAQGLTAAKRALYTPSGELDVSVAGLHASRTAITDLISQAKQAGANNTVRELEGALKSLDATLEAVPAYGQARRNFEAASRPLSPFDDGRAVGKAIERDQFGKEFALPAERVPGTIQQGGAAAARDFNSVASDPARRAYEQHLATQVMDGAKVNGTVKPENIRAALRENEDVFAQFPAVRKRLEAVADNADAVSRLSATPLGKLADKDKSTQEAIETLFPKNPVPNSEREVQTAVQTLSARNPWAARQLVRAHAEQTFNQATKDLQAGANQFGGANFAAQLRGNFQQNANMLAAVSSLPNGQQILGGFDRMLQVMEATGQRQRIGSQTAFNQEVQAALKNGSSMVQGGALAAGAGMKLPSRIMERVQQWNLGKNTEEIARLLTDPNAASAFRALAEAPVGSAKAGAALTRLTSLADRGREKERP